MDLLNNCEIKLGEQINPCCELDQWLRKLSFQHKVKRVRGWNWSTTQTDTLQTVEVRWLSGISLGLNDVHTGHIYIRVERVILKIPQHHFFAIYVREVPLACRYTHSQMLLHLNSSSEWHTLPTISVFSQQCMNTSENLFNLHEHVFKCPDMRDPFGAFQHSEKENKIPCSKFLYLFHWVRALLLQSQSNTWPFPGELLIRRSIHCKLFAFTLWCSTGFKEQLIMTLWTHLWNEKTRDT